MPQSPRYLIYGFKLSLFLLILSCGQSTWAETKCWNLFLGKPGSIITYFATDKEAVLVAGRLMEEGGSPGLWVAMQREDGHLIWQLRLQPEGYHLYPLLARSSKGYWIIAKVLQPSVAARQGGSLTVSQIWPGEVSREGTLIREKTLAPHRVNPCCWLPGRTLTKVLGLDA